jgi:anti-sigma B factor antagonist
MQVTSISRGGVQALALSGRLDAASAGQVAEPLEALLTSGERRVLLDLGGVDYVSSAGLQVLLRAAKLADAEGARLVLCGVKAYVLEVLQIVGFAALLEMEPDCARAWERL